MVTVKAQSGDIAKTQTDAIVVNLLDGIKSPGGGTGAVDQAMDGAYKALSDLRSQRVVSAIGAGMNLSLIHI